MKLYLKAALVLSFLFTTTSYAWVASAPIEKTYAFKFKMNQETYEYTASSTSYEDAYEKAAKSCYQHFKGGRRISEDTGLDIIDVCANPRST